MTDINVAFPSRYVKRCQRCRQVRGNSSFVRQGHKITNVCRTCRDREANKRQEIRVHEWTLRSLRASERDLRRQLDDVGRKIARLERNAEIAKLELQAAREQSRGVEVRATTNKSVA